MLILKTPLLHFEHRARHLLMLNYEQNYSMILNYNSLQNVPLAAQSGGASIHATHLFISSTELAIGASPINETHKSTLNLLNNVPQVVRSGGANIYVTPPHVHLRDAVASVRGQSSPSARRQFNT